MEVVKMSTSATSSDKNKQDEDDQEVMLPGFRFHPTDEELVGFYLRRKVEKKPISIEIIKQVDIYKYDPWDLPRVSTVGDKECYFFCIRGRKYRNSIRPNRVTGSGFWKATGIDKPIHSVKEPHECIGLKKSLVYYRGSAGKGTKTDWMMHEFRLPPNGKSTNLSNVKDIAQEAEVWTLCRIFKRTPSYKKYTANWKDGHSTTTVAANAIKLHNPTDSISSKTCSSSLESETSCDQQQQQQQQQFYYMHQVQNETKPFIITNDNIGERNHLFMTQLSSQSPYSASYNPSFWNPNSDDFLANGNWDELGSVVELAIDPSHVYDCR